MERTTRGLNIALALALLVGGLIFGSRPVAHADGATPPPTPTSTSGTDGAGGGGHLGD
jgi:hypothetical protein